MRLQTKGWRLGLGLILALAGAGCGSGPRTNYYTVRLPNPPAATSSGNGQLGVAVVQAEHLLRQDRIVYFNQQHGLNFYHYHRWAEPPAFMVQSALIRRIQAAGMFGDVVAYRAQKGLDYVLRGRLLALEEVDTATEVSARFGLQLELVRQEDARVVWNNSHHCERPVGIKSVDAVVDALSGCVEEGLTQLISSLSATVSELQRAAAAKKQEGNP
jgi:ABC-type uncharacterized transport system auxiliary subunit